MIPDDGKVPAQPVETIDDPMRWEPSRSFLNYAIGFILAGVAAFDAVVGLFAPEQVSRAMYALGLAPVAVITWFLLRRGRTRAAVWTLGVGVWTFVTLVAWLLGGLSTSVVVMYPLVILLAGWMYSTRAAAALAGLTILATLALAIGEYFGRLPAVVPASPAMRWVILAFTCGLTAVLVHYFLRAYRSRLQDLRLQSERLRLGQATARMLVMDWDVASDTITWSDSPEWLRGPLPPGGRYPFYKDQVHPEDRARWLESRNRRIGGLAEDSVDYRFVRTDGQVLWIHSRRKVFSGADGKAVRMLVALRDVTEAKRVELELRASEARFRSLTVLSSDWYWEQDAQLRFVSTSGRTGGFGGITAEDHVGRTRWELPHTEILGQGWDEHRATLEARKSFRDLLIRRSRPDGSEYFVQVAGEPTFDAAGGFTGYRGVARDVTERVQAERKARASDELLGSALEHLGESIAITDAEDRILHANRYFRELNGNTRLVDPGCHYTEHLRAGLSLGNYPGAIGREEEWLAERMARRRSGGTLEVQRQDGKWLQVTDRLLPAGGIVTFALDITARKMAEIALRASEARFRDFANASAQWFWETDAEGRFTWFSDSVRRFSGYPPEWYYGQMRTDLAASPENLAREPWTSHLAALERHEPFRDFRYQRAAPRGALWLSVSGLPCFDDAGRFTGYRGSGIDITEIVLAERQAEATRQLLRSALEDLGEMICLTDAQDRIVLANRRFVEFNAGVADYVAEGRRYDEHLRAGIARGMFPEALGREEEWIAERMAVRRQSRGPVERRRQDGRWLMVDDQVLPDGGVISWGLEITERKRAEETLRDMNQELERRVAERTAELESTYRELESFSYSVSHDLRAPLRAVTGFSTIVLEKEGPRVSEEGRRYLGVIDANARRMARLIDALLALGRYTRVALNRTEVDIGEIAREVRDELAGAFPDAVIEVGELPPALGNATLLKQVFLNLVGNALKYSARAAAPRVEIRAEGGRYVVSDNGAGFDMAYADKLFRPFERLHSEAEYEGTGIGLAIVKLIVERHGGRVEAQGVPGQGARFSFTLGGAG